MNTENRQMIELLQNDDSLVASDMHQFTFHHSKSDTTFFYGVSSECIVWHLIAFNNYQVNIRSINDLKSILTQINAEGNILRLPIPNL